VIIDLADFTKRTCTKTNDQLLTDPVLSGEIPDLDGLFSLGSASKRLKSMFAQTLSVVATLTQFASLAITTNKIILWNWKCDDCTQCPTPTNSQVVSVPDSKVQVPNSSSDSPGLQQVTNGRMLQNTLCSARQPIKSFWELATCK
jgi:hypothetical protein